MNPYYYTLFVFLSVNIKVFVYAQKLKSPCPDKFQYELENGLEDKWNGIVNMKVETEYSGIWLELVFDKPILGVETDFGDVEQIETTEFLIQQPGIEFNIGQNLNIKFTVLPDPSEKGLPQLLGFRLNTQVLCPVNGVIPPTTSVPPAGIESPCPDLFTYEPVEPNTGVWFGNLFVRSEKEYNGVWIRVVLNKPPIHFGSDFGEIKQTEPTKFVIKSQYHKFKAGDQLHIRINATFIPGEIPPKVMEIFLNAHPYCEGKSKMQKQVTPILITPCPNSFTYEKQELGKWTGALNLNTDFALSGIWVTLLFQEVPVEILTDFGDVIKSENSSFIISKPNYKVNRGDSIKIHFTVRYNLNEIPSKLIDFYLNGRPICNKNEEIQPLAKMRTALTSPCPDIFSYVQLKNQKEIDKWNGIIYLKSDVDLYGLWIEIILDKPAIQLGVNWFAEVNTKDNLNYLISKPNYILARNSSEILPFYIRYNPNVAFLPLLKEIRFNARTVCLANKSSSNINVRDST